jgi:hypothetical protein
MVLSAGAMKSLKVVVGNEEIVEPQPYITC